MTGPFSQSVELRIIARFVSSGDVLDYKPLKASKFSLANSILRESVLVHKISDLLQSKEVGTSGLRAEILSNFGINLLLLLPVLC